MEEQEAIARLKRGDIGGLEALVKLYQVRAVRTAYLITRDRSTAEDVVQAMFLHAFEQFAQYDAERPFGPWFLRCVINSAIKATTRSRRHVRLEKEDGTSVAEFLAAPDTFDAAETRDAVWSALGKLPAEQRAAIVLRYYLGLNESEMAEELICPPGTVKWRLHTARKRLRTLLLPFWSAAADLRER